jgi:hypothetical protein
MPEPTKELRSALQRLAQALRDAHHLGPEAQRQLAGLVEEMGRTLDAETPSAEELHHLSDGAARLAQAVQKRDQGMLASARGRLDAAAAEAEAQSFAVGLALRLAETLANIGI